MAEKEYIEREYMEEIITMLKSEKGDIRVMDTETLLYFIRKVPAVDVAPVKHGHWINENFYTRCSACGNMAIYDKYGQEVESDYCPRCGARMGSDAAIEKPFTILNCPECGGEVDIKEISFDDIGRLAMAFFECKKCHKCISVATEYKNDPHTAVSLEWNKYVVSREAYKPVKSAAEEIARNGVPVKHGHWKKGKGNERPTENGFVHDDRYFCDCCGWGCCCDTKLDFRYCPNCGAKMGGEVE